MSRVDPQLLSRGVVRVMLMLPRSLTRQDWALACLGTGWSTQLSWTRAGHFYRLTTGLELGQPLGQLGWNYLSASN